jgi:transposase
MMPARKKNTGSRVDALLGEGTLNLSADKVRDPKFREGEFFDPHDIVQVKYEMLRRVQVDNASIIEATAEYGVSRPTYYHTVSSFNETGVAGLVPRKRGPRGPHKIQSELLTYLENQIVSGQPIRARALVSKVQKQFGVTIHPRTIERALKAKKNAI